MKRMVGVWVIAVGLVLPAPVEAKEHGGKEHAGQEHGGSAMTEPATAQPAPPGLSQQGKAPTGLEKQEKTPAGWKRGKKTGWQKSRTSRPKKSQEPNSR